MPSDDNDENLCHNQCAKELDLAINKITKMLLCNYQKIVMCFSTVLASELLAQIF